VQAGRAMRAKSARCAGDDDCVGQAGWSSDK
jgi:hypothetical protein